MTTRANEPLPSLPVCQNGTVIEQSAAGRPRLPSHSVIHSSAWNCKVAEAPPAAQHSIQAPKARATADRRRRRSQRAAARPQCPRRPNARAPADRINPIALGTIDLGELVAVGSILLRSAGWSRARRGRALTAVEATYRVASWRAASSAGPSGGSALCARLRLAALPLGAAGGKSVRKRNLQVHLVEP